MLPNSSLTVSVERSRRLLFAALFIAILIVAGITIALGIYLRQQAQSRIEVNTQNLALSIERSISQMVESVDSTLLSVKDELDRENANDGIHQQILVPFVRRQLERETDIESICITNDKYDYVLKLGKQCHWTSAELADIRNTNRNSHVPFLHSSANTGDHPWVWAMVRSYFKPDGSYGGTVLGHISLERLNAEFSSYQLDSGGSIALRDGELKLITRYVVGSNNLLQPGDTQISQPFEDALRIHANSGTYVSGSSSLDGINRTHSYQSSLKYDFLVNVGMAGEAAFQDWRKLMWVSGVLVAAFAAAASVLVWILLRSWRHHENDYNLILATKQSLQASEERFHSLFSSMLEGFAFHRLILDSQGKAVDYEILEVNDAFTTHTGLERAQVVGQLASTVYGTPEAPFLAVYTKVVQTCTPVQIEQRFEPLHKDFLIRAYAAADGYFATVFEDITQRNQLAKEQTESHRKLEVQYEEILVLQEKLMVQALRDPLTGLHNRRYMDETLPRELARAKRENYPLSLILLDLDHFKKVNDTYGHAIGDHVLTDVANILKKSCREGDIVCRYGGEEFLIALPHMTADQAVRKMDDGRKEVENTVFQYDGVEIRITISAGVSCYPEHASDVDLLLKLSDNALYQSKHNGRNRVTASTGPDPFQNVLRSHLQWKSQLEAALASGKEFDVETIRCDDRCELGRWLHGVGRQKYGHLPEFVSLLDKHRMFHVVTSEVALDVNKKDTARVKELLQSSSKFVTASHEVGVAILQLQACVDQDVGEVHG